MKILGYFCNNSLLNKIFFITFAALMIISPLSLAAQERGGQRGRGHFDREKFLVKRSAFITAELKLTPEEAAEFIPLAEELQQKKFEAGQACRKLQRDIHTKTNPTDAEYTEAINECLHVGTKEAQLEKEYYEKFKKILSPGKLYKYKNAEIKFAREFMKEQGAEENNTRNN